MDQAIQRLLFHSAKHFDLAGYMERYWLTPDPKTDPEQKISARLHHLISSDRDEALHCHPFQNISLIQAGGAWEITPKSQDQPPSMDSTHFNKVWLSPGMAVYRKATDRHRLLLEDGGDMWSIFVIGPWERDWGFWTPEGWVFWREYLNQWGDDPLPGESIEPRK